MTFRSTGDTHAQGFLECLRSRKKPAADAEVGHYATIPGHLMSVGLFAEVLTSSFLKTEFHLGLDCRAAHRIRGASETGSTTRHIPVAAS